VDPDYLETMRIPLLAGESLPQRLERGQPVPVLVSQSAARRLWSAEDPIGRRIRVPWGESTVVGVVGDVRQTGLSVQAQPAVYFPQLIAPRLMATLVLRTTGEPSALAGPVRELVKEIDPDQPIRSIEPLEQLMAESIAEDRFYTILFAVFGGLGIVLASIGVYGVLAYSVRQRRQEIGVRVALGGSAADVLRLVGGAGIKLVVPGLIIGTAAALALSRVLASQLYGITPTDPVSFAVPVAFLTAAALCAIWIPVRRAMGVPPMTALEG
jgi:putative ABC transport system permease protein